MAVDGDLSSNGIVTYTLTQPSPATSQPSFSVHPLTGSLTKIGNVNVALDYRLIITATVCQCFSVASAYL